ncbi:MAG TPA: glutamyl-tRNA reductase [Pyrinomonadaceae bacterium]|nr:glutamyl-tRNA reductase [Pyrinomonadaceae bacterium]
MDIVDLSMAGYDEIPGASTAKTLFAFGLNHKTAQVEVREHLYLRDDEIPALLSIYKQELDECMVLSTCNRTEVYCVSSAPEIDVDHFKQILIDFKNAADVVTADDFFSLTSCSSSHQIFNVATSIDSQVIGDSQILSQLRHAYMLAQEAGATGKILHQLVQRACKLGKQTYNNTSLHHGAASISLAAVELAIADAGPLRSRTALIMGAGEMARTTAEALAKRHIGRLIIANRTLSKAEELRDALITEFAVDCDAVDLRTLSSQLLHADIIVGATGSPDLVLMKADLAGIMRKQLLIDIAVPRDIDPEVAELEDVTLKNIDDLRQIMDSHHERRTRDLPRVKKMIVDEMVSFLTWYYAQPLLPAVLKKGQKPTQAEAAEIVRVKEFLNDNLTYIHRLAAQSNGDFATELNNHFLVIEQLRRLKAETFNKAASV